MNRLTATNRLNDGGRHIVENPQAADLSVDLTNSLIPRRGVGSVTYTRPGVATVTDHEGVIRTVNSGEARFLGARRVENMLGYSQDFTNAAWTKINSSVSFDTITGPAGITGRVSKMVESAGLTQHGISTGASISNLQGNTYISSIYAKAGTRNFIQLLTSGSVGVQYANFNLTNGTFSESSAGVGAMVSVGNGWYRCSIKYTSTTTNVALAYCMIGTSLSDTRYFGYTGDGTSFVYIQAFQHEDATGQSVQTAGEYVSRNVLTSSPFHGANVDGVKYFNTTLSGATISPSILKGYICEAGKTNLFLYSDEFVISWVRSGGGSLLLNQGLSPDGTMGMDKFIPSTSSLIQYIGQSVTTTANVYTCSFHIKSSGLNYVQIWSSGTISNGYVNFDLSTGTVTATSIWTGVIEALPNGVYRCSIITDTVLAATGSFVLAVVPTSTSTRATVFTGNGTDGIFLWGAQLELGDFPSSYIPTTTATVTRNTDSLSYSSANIVGSQGAAYVESSLILPGNTTSSASSRFLLSRGASGRMFYISSAINNINNYDGTTILSSNSGTSMNGNVIKMASSWSGSTKGIYYGTSVPKTSAFNGTMGTGNIDVGATWNGTIRNLKIWKTPPTVAELTSITTL